MYQIAKRMRARRNARDLQRAIETAGTPAMRDELLVIAQRQFIL